MKIVAFGRTEILSNIITELAKSENMIGAIITSDPTQTQYEFGIDHFRQLSEKLGSKFFTASDLLGDDIITSLKSIKPDIAISLNWPTLVPKEFIDIFPEGIVNVHAGNLPRFRGNSVRNWALINGEKSISLTLHKMDAELDTGPILQKKSYPINQATNIKELYDFVSHESPKMVSKLFTEISQKTVKPIPQSEDIAESLRCYPRLPIDSEIDWSKDAEDIQRLVSASSEPFPGAYTFLGNKKLIIWETKVIIPEFEYLAAPGQVTYRNSSSGTVSVATGKGFIEIIDAELEGGFRMAPNKILNTIRLRLGMSYSEEIRELRDDINFLKKKLGDLK
tara:strand:- start:17003 stop:18010 length:1008 start_codon:yes stop_codon:yes gene_type:complete